MKDTDQLLHYTGSAWSLFPAAKILTVSATDKVLGRSSSGAGAAEEIACTAAGRALIDDADAAAQRATLGLGTAATQNTGTSGANIPLLNGTNTWNVIQSFAVTSAGAKSTPVVLPNGSSTAGSEAVLRFNAASGTDRWAEIAAKNDGANTLSIVVRPSTGGVLSDIASFHVNGADIAGVLQVDSLQPRLDDTFDLGTASLRFDDIYATNGTIQTSDAREKSPLRPFAYAEKRGIGRIVAGIGVFQWLGPLAAKGADARLHCGITAQAEKEAFEVEGLDPARYALFCADAAEEEVEVEGTVRVRRPRLDEQGQPVLRLGVRHDQLSPWRWPPWRSRVGKSWGRRRGGPEAHWRFIGRGGVFSEFFQQISRKSRFSLEVLDEDLQWTLWKVDARKPLSRTIRRLSRSRRAGLQREQYGSKHLRTAPRSRRF